MIDRFLTEVRRLHDMRATIRGLSADERAALARYLNDIEALDGEAGEWLYEARDAQLPPRDLDWGWLFLGGRGTGKSHAMSCAVHIAVRAGLKRIHLVGPLPPTCMT
jgi:phage terminase large subunit-like protein